MWVIIDDNITDIAVGEDHPSFTKESMLSNTINDKWKATSVDDTVTLTVSSGDTIALFGTNATSVAIYKGAVLPGNLLTTEFNATLGCAVAYHTGDASPYSINVVMSTGSGFLECGKMVAGYRTSFIDPKYGMGQGFKNTSIVKELHSGSYYTKRKQMPRTFDVQIDEDRDSDFYTFMRTYYNSKGPEPCCWRLNDSLTTLEWLVWACMPEPPAGTHAYFTHSTIGFKLVENL